MNRRSRMPRALGAWVTRLLVPLPVLFGLPGGAFGAPSGTSVTISYTAWDTSANAWKTGDSANHTLRWIKDGASAAPTNSPSEVDATNAPGLYKITLTASECACNVGTLAGKSSTANVVIIPTQLAFESTVTLANGAHGGAAATLTLSSATIANAGGTGLSITGTTHGVEIAATNGPGIEVAGTTYGIQAAAAGGPGVGISGTTAGISASASAAGSSGFYAASTGGAAAYGIRAVCAGGTPIAGDFTGNLTGNLSGSVGSLAGFNVTGSGLTAIPWNPAWDAEAQSEADDALQALGYTAARSAKLDSLDAAISTRAAAATALSNAVWTDAKAGYLTGNVALAAVCTEPRLANLDAAVSSRSTLTAADVWGYTTRALTDKAGFALSAAGVDAFWDEAASGHTTAGTYGLYIQTILKVVQSH